MNNVRERGFADPADKETCHGDAKLNRCEVAVEIIVCFFYQSGATVAAFDHLFETAGAQSDKREFGENEKGIGGDKKCR